MSSDVVVYGTGGFAREVHQVISDINQHHFTWNFLGFLDDDRNKWGAKIHGYPVLGGLEWLRDNSSVYVAIGIGNPSIRRKVVMRIEEACKSPLATLIHPRAWIGNHVEIGEGSIICAGTLITTDVHIGKCVILNLDCTVGHDCVIEDFVTVAPSVNISGGVRVGNGCELGTGSAIIQGIEIGPWTIVGAGAVVIKSLPPNVTAVGVPAKVVKQRDEGWYEE